MCYNVISKRGNGSQEEEMRTHTRVLKYGKALRDGGLPAVWGIMSKPRRRYAAHLVREYGYPVRQALSRAYVFGFDAFPYDFRSGRACEERLTAKSFGL